MSFLCLWSRNMVLLSSYMAILFVTKDGFASRPGCKWILMAWDKNAWEKLTFTLKNFKVWSVFTCQVFIKHGMGIQQETLPKYGLCINSHHIPDKLSSITGYFICNPIIRREHKSGIPTIRELWRTHICSQTVVPCRQNTKKKVVRLRKGETVEM